MCVCATADPSPYLQGVLGADGQDLVLEVAELAAPGASLADPADEAGLMGAAHGAVTAAGAQQLPLQDRQGNYRVKNSVENKFNRYKWISLLLVKYKSPSLDLQERTYVDIRNCM